VANVVDNALKFTPPGGRVGVSIENRGDQAVVVIRDSGPGIGPEDEERVFARFFRSATNPTGMHGAGLGLALARDIARASGGDLILRPPADGGARFELFVPRS
jgi:signal transduction histidine kinase